MQDQLATKPVALLLLPFQATSFVCVLFLQGLTYVSASSGRLWSTALRMDSSKAEGAAKSVVRCAFSSATRSSVLVSPCGQELGCCSQVPRTAGVGSGALQSARPPASLFYTSPSQPRSLSFLLSFLQPGLQPARGHRSAGPSWSPRAGLLCLWAIHLSGLAAAAGVCSVQPGTHGGLGGGGPR